MMIYGIFNKKGYGKEYFMNKEIKEILKIFKKCEFGACITKHNSRVLIDYITNLQEENNLYLRRSYEAYEVKEEYKLRIEKALEWIGSYEDMNLWFECPKEEMKELINILQGEDNE